MHIHNAIDFDDVLLMPQRSSISSRFNGDIDLSTNLYPKSTKLKLKYPIISSNMDTITEIQMAETMIELGGLGIIHRFLTIKEHQKQLHSLPSPRIVCIGVGKQELERLHVTLEYTDGVLIDIAHGHSEAMIQQIREVRKLVGDLPIIAGNIATKQAAVDLIEAGANVLKVGISPGFACRTRLNTGVGIPQLTAILNVAEATREVNKPVTLIADGGIKNAGDIVKALACGADAVMCGYLFSGTSETPGELFSTGDMSKPLYKRYRGMASREAQLSWKGQATSVEGESINVPFRGSVVPIFEDLIANILSGFSYLNAHNITELRKNAEFVRNR